jgi:hypothetical protein
VNGSKENIKKTGGNRQNSVSRNVQDKGGKSGENTDF